MGVSPIVSVFHPLFSIFSVLADRLDSNRVAVFGYGFGAITFIIFNAVFFISRKQVAGVSTIPPKSETRPPRSARTRANAHEVLLRGPANIVTASARTRFAWRGLMPPK